MGDVVSATVNKGMGGAASQMVVVFEGDGPGVVNKNLSVSIGNYTINGIVVSKTKITSANGNFTEVKLEDDITSYLDDIYITSNNVSEIEVVEGGKSLSSVYAGAGLTIIECIDSGGATLSELRSGGIRIPSEVDEVDGSDDAVWSFNGVTEYAVVQSVVGSAGLTTYVDNGEIKAIPLGYDGTITADDRFVISKKIGTATNQESIAVKPGYTLGIQEDTNLGPWYPDAVTRAEVYTKKGILVIGGYDEKISSYSPTAAWGGVIPYNDTECAVALKGYEVWRLWKSNPQSDNANLTGWGGITGGGPEDIWDSARRIIDRQMRGPETEERWAKIAAAANAYYGKMYTFKIEDGWEVVGAAHPGVLGLVNPNFRVFSEDGAVRYNGWMTGGGLWGPDGLEDIPGETFGGAMAFQTSPVGGQNYGGSIFPEGTYSASPPAYPVNGHLTISNRKGEKYNVYPASKGGLSVYVPLKSKTKRHVYEADLSAITRTISDINEPVNISEVTVVGPPPGDITGPVSLSVSLTIGGGLISTISAQTAKTVPAQFTPKTIKAAALNSDIEKIRRPDAKKDTQTRHERTSKSRTKDGGAASANDSPFIDTNLLIESNGDNEEISVAQLDYPTYSGVYLPKGSALYVGTSKENYIDSDGYLNAVYRKWEPTNVPTPS